MKSVTTIGIDLAKNSFAVYGVNAKGTPVQHICVCPACRVLHLSIFADAGYTLYVNSPLPTRQGYAYDAESLRDHPGV